jgi:hypothetical protein
LEQGHRQTRARGAVPSQMKRSGRISSLKLNILPVLGVRSIIEAYAYLEMATGRNPSASAVPYPHPPTLTPTR